MQELFCVFFIFFVRAAKRRAEEGAEGGGERRNKVLAKYGVRTMGKPCGAGANAGWRLVDNWLKCYEWSILPKFQETLSGQAHEVRLADNN